MYEAKEYRGPDAKAVRPEGRERGFWEHQPKSESQSSGKEALPLPEAVLYQRDRKEREDKKIGYRALERVLSS